MPAALSKIKNRHKQNHLKEVLKNKKKRIRLILLVSGLLFVGLGLGSRFIKQSSESQTLDIAPTVILQTSSSFSSEPVKIDKGFFSQKDTVRKSPPIRIALPDLSVDIPIKEAKVINGFWEVFADSAGFGLGSAYPADVGNTVVFAHGREGLFLPLKKAKLGQKVYLFTKDGWYSYVVKEIKEVLPAQVEVIAPTTDATLTLYTCSGFLDSNRLIIVAKRSID